MLNSNELCSGVAGPNISDFQPGWLEVTTARMLTFTQAMLGLIEGTSSDVIHLSPSPFLTCFALRIALRVQDLISPEGPVGHY